MYIISFYGKRYSKKPVSGEIAEINNKLSEKRMTYIDMANEIGENGCSFAPAVFNGRRKQDNFKEQQLIALDFDDGTTFDSIRLKAEKYGLSILFAYKTFSWTANKEKFRVVFAMGEAMKSIFIAKSVILIFMRIFTECDLACKDVSRMFFGGKGLLYVAEIEYRISMEILLTGFSMFMADTYGERHYKEKIREFYSKNNIQIALNTENSATQVLEQEGKCTLPIINNSKCANSPESSTGIELKVPDIALPRRKVVRNFDWDSLYECCQLFRNFYDGTEYYYYPELFHIATNLCNIEKGKRMFLEILNYLQNSQYKAYQERNWNVVLNNIIKSDYKPQSCENCKYSGECNHLKNMILTAKPSKRDIKVVEEQKYYSIEKAEKSLMKSFQKALKSDDENIHIIKSQTGIGKTHLYLNYLKNAKNPFIIAVPTHALKKEIYQKALKNGVTDIVCTPEMPEFSGKLMKKIEHCYNIGAGSITMEKLRKIFGKMDRKDKDYKKLERFLEESEAIRYDGHIITTHERLLYIPKNSDILNTHQIIIDEDILRTLYSTCSVSVADIRKVLDCEGINKLSKKRLKSILESTGYQRYSGSASATITEDVVKILKDVTTNVFDLLESETMYVGNDEVIFINKRYLPRQKIIIMSATANASVYRNFIKNREVIEYQCKKAKYIGKVVQYANHTYSRCCMRSNEEIVKYLKKETAGDVVITFKEFEELFESQYHFGNTEGINCLEGKNISVVGLPNISDIVYKLYGMIAGVSLNNQNMYPMRVQHNGYDFSMHTFSNPILKLIQIWLIESLLEQAVGRARLLRFDCTVKVFAGFPVEQAQFV